MGMLIISMFAMSENCPNQVVIFHIPFSVGLRTVMGIVILQLAVKISPGSDMRIYAA